MTDTATVPLPYARQDTRTIWKPVIQSFEIVWDTLRPNDCKLASLVQHNMCEELLYLESNEQATTSPAQDGSMQSIAMKLEQQLQQQQLQLQLQLQQLKEMIAGQEQQQEEKENQQQKKQKEEQQEQQERQHEEHGMQTEQTNIQKQGFIYN